MILYMIDIGKIYDVVVVIDFMLRFFDYYYFAALFRAFVVFDIQFFLYSCYY